MKKETAEQPDAEGAKVTQKTQKIPKEKPKFMLSASLA
jgi:hypothetical protein